MMSVCFCLHERRVEICIDVKNQIDDSFEEQDTDVVIGFSKIHFR